MVLLCTGDSACLGRYRRGRNSRAGEGFGILDGVDMLVDSSTSFYSCIISFRSVSGGSMRSAVPVASIFVLCAFHI